MKRLLLSFLTGISAAALHAQTAPAASKPEAPYQQSAEKINDLVHTKLDARFDYQKAQLNGKVWLTLKPHFYPTDSLALDAKGMDIHSVAIVKGSSNTPLKYDYDNLMLRIHLDRTYKGGEPYTIYINYTAKPDEYKGQGSAAITNAKGLYFINPRGEDPEKPTQIWTQGETESNSVWIPIIDKPDQKTTDEIAMTVPAKYVTLSNGKLASQKKNADGTRTDTWKMELPHAPYLMFMGVGDYAVVKDSYKGKEVSYYVEKEYAPVARKIFGNTPEMIAFYSRITGVEFPWAKYSQIVGRDYVSGAMENTTATLHQESAQQDARELTDGNTWEDVIAHELFHQWFGDYVTTESWSNLTLNESFADYSEYLWNEYKYGKDKAGEVGYNAMQGYLKSHSEAKNLVRFHYNDKEDMFDAVSYNKGGRILHMLRNYVGDSAFFKALNLYLTTNKFKSAEAHNLRLAFEEVTGKDLNWFFNQWYFGAGNPVFDISYGYNEATKKATVVVAQKQAGDKLFQMPIAIDVYNGGAKKRYNVWVKNRLDSFAFDAATKPDLINFDGDKMVLAQKTENKTIDNYFFQYKNAETYVDRREAIDAAAKDQTSARAQELLLLALTDRFAGLRTYAISNLDLKQQDLKTRAEATLAKIAQSDAARLVKAAAIAKLGDYKNAKYESLFKTAVGDSSYTVSARALVALNKVDSVAAQAELKKLSGSSQKGALGRAMNYVTFNSGNLAAATLDEFERLPLGEEKLNALNQKVFNLLQVTESQSILQRGVNDVVKIISDVPAQYRDEVSKELLGVLRQLQQQKESQGQKEQAEYIASVIKRNDKDQL